MPAGFYECIIVESHTPSISAQVCALKAKILNMLCSEQTHRGLLRRIMETIVNLATQNIVIFNLPHRNYMLLGKCTMESARVLRGEKPHSAFIHHRFSQAHHTGNRCGDENI
jgi:hypothetical protein